MHDIEGEVSPIFHDAKLIRMTSAGKCCLVLLNIEAAMSQLELGQVAGYARDGVLLMSALQTVKNPADFTLLPDRLSSEPIAIAYRQGDPALQKLVDLSIVDAMRNGLLKQSYDKWFNKPMAPANKAINLPMSPELSALLAAAK